jgi:hypothetical protein
VALLFVNVANQHSRALAGESAYDVFADPPSPAGNGYYLAFKPPQALQIHNKSAENSIPATRS